MLDYMLQSANIPPHLAFTTLVRDYNFALTCAHTRAIPLPELSPSQPALLRVTAAASAIKGPCAHISAHTHERSGVACSHITLGYTAVYTMFVKASTGLASRLTAMSR